MDFHTRQLTMISVLASVLLIAQGVIQDKSNQTSNELMLINSKRNIESLDYILLTREEAKGAVGPELVAMKKIALDDYDRNISRFVSAGSRLSLLLNLLILAIVVLNCSAFFPLSHGENLKVRPVPLTIYRCLFFIAILVACGSVLVGLAI